MEKDCRDERQGYSLLFWRKLGCGMGCEKNKIPKLKEQIEKILEEAEPPSP